MGLAIASCLMLQYTDAEAGYFATITIDDPYGDWAGVPVVDSDGGDNSDGPDIGDTQIAHDGQNLYIRNTFPNSLALSTYIAIDVDQNPATGFDILGLGLWVRKPVGKTTLASLRPRASSTAEPWLARISAAAMP